MDIVEWLIKHHSMDEIINKQDNYGNAPLHFAIRGGKSKKYFYFKSELKD